MYQKGILFFSIFILSLPSHLSQPCSPSLPCATPYKTMVGPAEDYLMIIIIIFITYFHFIWPIYFTIYFLSSSCFVASFRTSQRLMGTLGRNWDAPLTLLLGAHLYVGIDRQTDRPWLVLCRVLSWLGTAQSCCGRAQCLSTMLCLSACSTAVWFMSPACFTHVWTKVAWVECNCLCILLSLISTAIVLTALPALLVSSPLSLFCTSSPVKFISLVLLTVSAVMSCLQMLGLLSEIMHFCYLNEISVFHLFIS